MKRNKNTVFTVLIILMAVMAQNSFAKLMMGKSCAREFLGVSNNATLDEIEREINILRSQKVIRQPGFWGKVVKAYEALTGKEFTLFGIDDARGLTFDLEPDTTVEKAFKHLGVRYGATGEEIEAGAEREIKKITDAYELLMGERFGSQDLFDAIKNVEDIARRILGVGPYATKEQIEEAAERIWAYEIVRTPGQLIEINNAYHLLTGKKFDLFLDEALLKMTNQGARKILGVGKYSTRQEIDVAAKKIRMQEIMRPEEDWQRISNAYYFLTGKKFRD